MTINKPGRRAEVRRSTLSAILATVVFGPTNMPAGPSAEVAKRCMHNSYLVSPYKSRGSMRMSGYRLAYLRDFITKEGQIPESTETKF